MIGAQEVQRYVWLVAHHPAVVRDRGNMKEIAGGQLDDVTTDHGCGGTTRHNQPYVLDFAPGGVGGGPDVLAPFPARLVSCATDCHAADMHDFEFALFESAKFVSFVKPLENYFQIVLHRHSRIIGGVAARYGMSGGMYIVLDYLQQAA